MSPRDVLEALTLSIASNGAYNCSVHRENKISERPITIV